MVTINACYKLTKVKNHIKWSHGRRLYLFFLNQIFYIVYFTFYSYSTTSPLNTSYIELCSLENLENVFVTWTYLASSLVFPLYSFAPDFYIHYFTKNRRNDASSWIGMNHDAIFPARTSYKLTNHVERWSLSQ